MFVTFCNYCITFRKQAEVIYATLLSKDNYGCVALWNWFAIMGSKFVISLSNILIDSNRLPVLALNMSTKTRSFRNLHEFVLPYWP